MGRKDKARELEAAATRHHGWARRQGPEPGQTVVKTSSRAQGSMALGLDYLLWGTNPVGYHLTSLLLHTTNGVVFYFLVLRILTVALRSPSERGHALTVSAGFAALLFAIHPLRVESVAWATERRD